MKINTNNMRCGLFCGLILLLGVSCQKTVVGDEGTALETTTIHFIPEELDIDVEPASRAVLGETDIYCYAFVNNTLVEGYPAKQTEINNGVYSFIIPKSTNTRLCFVIKPDWLGWKTSSGNVIFDIWWMNREEIELYSSYSQWYDTSSEGVQTISASLNQQHYDIHLRFQFINFPSDPKDVIKDLYLTLSDAVGLNFSLDELLRLHSRKTGALINAACVLGAMAAGLRPGDARLERVNSYAESIGLAFQIVDDILDVTGDESALGKRTGVDAAHQKNTFLRFYPVEQAQLYADRLTRAAVEAVRDWPGSEMLCALAEWLARRKQ